MERRAIVMFRWERLVEFFLFFFRLEVEGSGWVGGGGVRERRRDCFFFFSLFSFFSCSDKKKINVALVLCV
jgi:hypothetical protein